MEIARTQLWSLHTFLPSTVVLTVDIGSEEPSYAHIRLSVSDRRKYMASGSLYLDALARKIMDKPESFFSARYDFT
jgi:hypothetical protein